MGLAASAMGGSASGRCPRFTKIITSKASANATEAPARYGWKGLDGVDSDKAFNVPKAIQQMRETILMFTATFIPCDPILCVQETKGYTESCVSWTECLRIASGAKPQKLERLRQPGQVISSGARKDASPHCSNPASCAASP